MSNATEVRSRPILFSAPMIRALLDGRKTQTRRVLKPQPRLAGNGADWYWDAPKYPRFGNVSGRWSDACPYGAVGDQLLVRETHYIEPGTTAETWDRTSEDEVVYAADGDIGWAGEGGIRWRPSSHMPRWASRITLEITGIRAERVQDITHRDCVAEGWPGADEVLCSSDTTSPFAGVTKGDWINAIGDGDDAAIEWYADLWESINGKGSWDANPWVWCITFSVVKP